jgi:uncharacterized membrane protein YheB (UPF0754 family)
MDWTPWIMLPVVGALIGYATNWLAIRMLFHPRKPTWGVQGLLPHRQAELAKSVGDVVGNELVPVDDLLRGLDDVDLTPHLAELLDQAISAKLEDLRRIPLIGGLVTPERIAQIRDSVLRQLKDKQPILMERFKQVVKERIDIRKIAEEKLGAFDLIRLENIVNRVANKEFRAIEFWGLVLGFIIGVAQAGLLAIL